MVVELVKRHVREPILTHAFQSTKKIDCNIWQETFEIFRINIDRMDILDPKNIKIEKIKWFFISNKVDKKYENCLAWLKLPLKTIL